MKELLILISILLTSLGAKADCDLRRMEFWPTGSSISENSLIVIDAYQLSNQIILQLNQKHPIYLKFGDLKVHLKVKEILVGEAGLTQTILLPTKALIPGLVYQLYIDNIPENEMPSTSNWNPKSGKYEFPKWKVIKGRDIEKPSWILKPVESKKTFIHYGCGPEYYVHFLFQAFDQSEILIRTSVTSVSTNKTIVFYLKPENNEVLKVGRGMCGGAFDFNDGDNFEVTFDIIDANGNITKWSGDKIIFTKPTHSR